MSTETFTDDDLVIPHFEDELWRTLAQAHEDRRTGTMRLTPAVDQLHRRRGRRLVLSGIGAAAAAATLVVALSLRDGDGSAPQPAESAAIPADLVAKVGAAIAEANSTMIVVQTTTAAAMSYESWADEVSGSLRMVIRNGDTVVSDAHPSQVPTDAPSDHQATVFYYCNNTYTEIDALIDGQPNGSYTSFVQEGLEDGRLVPDGTEVIDGKELIRLVEKGQDQGLVLLPDSDARAEDLPNGFVVDGPPDDAPLVPTGGVVWVDPETYRPVKYHDAMNGMEKSYEYLERTPENVAQMSPPIPAGFTHVDPPPGGIGSPPMC